MHKRTTIDFGIHLGNSHSSIAVFNGGKPQVVKNNLDGDITPSAVFIGRQGNIIVGAKAKSKLEDERSAEDAYIEFKRRMGGDSVFTFKSSGLRKTPEELSAEVLKSLKGNVLQRMNEDIKAAVITIPAAYAQRQCAATKHAAELAGFTQCPLLQEPVAASLAYGYQLESEKSSSWLVFDFGGCSFDAAIMKAKDGDILVINHGGDNFLGGTDIDWGVIEKIIIPEITAYYNLPNFKRGNDHWRSAFAKIKRAVEFAKIDLSRSSETYLDGCVFEDDDGNEVELDGFKLTQNQLANIAEPLIVRAANKCKAVLSEKNLSPSAIEKAILVGGPTLAPYFRHILADKLGIPLDHSVDPLTTYAQGAAIFAGTQPLGGVKSRKIHSENLSGQEAMDNLVRLMDRDAPVLEIIDIANKMGLGSDPSALEELHRTAVRYCASSRNAPLFVISLNGVLQAEIALFAKNKIPGIDRTAYLKAMPYQVVRKLTGDSSEDSIADLLRTNYDFSRFKKENWEEYFSRCSFLFPAAQSFLARDEANGGFSEAKVTGILLRNPSLVPSVPSGRISPDTAVALLISGRAESLWETYDFSRLGKNQWRELFLHTNPNRLPEASRPFIENKDGKGFTDDELLTMAQKCHALINFLNPSKVPFNVVYELSLTGRADLLWKNYPFASLDKAEWRMVLANPHMKIPDHFLSVVGGGRFTVDELCSMSINNDRLFPVLLKLDITPDKIIKILLACKADYIWENYHFSRFAAADFAKLILGLKADAILKPRAMMALKTCRDLTEAQVRKILSKNPAYAPNVPISAIAPDVAVDLLIRGKSYFLWDAYDFKRLDDDLWLRLLANTKGVVPQLGKDFLQYRSCAVDNARLNVVLSRRRDLIEFVDAEYIAPDLAVSILMDKPRHKLWERFDFTRLDAKQLTRVINAHEYISGTFPKSLQVCFEKEGVPFSFQDLLELAAINPCIVVDNISTEWVEALDDNSFEKLVRLSVSNDSGAVSLRTRMNQGEKPWKALPRSKLKRLLALAPELRFSVGWDNWAFRDIAELARSNTTFERGIAHPIRYFVWKHFKSLVAMGALTAAAVLAVCLHSRELDRHEARRQYWNSIVLNVKEFDRKQLYRELNEFWNTIPQEDRAVVKDDLFVKRAFVNLAAWEADCEAVESGMSRLRAMSKAGWGMVTKDAVEAVIGELEKYHVDRFTVCSEFQSLKKAQATYRRQEAERARIKLLRDQLADINGRLSGCEDLAQLVKWRDSLNLMANERELEDEHSQLLKKVTRQIDKVSAEKIAHEIVAISNAVLSVSGEMKTTMALTKFSTWSAEYLRIKAMPGFDEYGKLPCYEAYVRLSEDFRKFDELRRGTVDKLAEAKRLGERFSKEFMTEEGGTACSNVVSYCDGALKVSKSKGWLALSGENEKIKKIIEEIYARDLRCWSLVDKVNKASDYASYLNAMTGLIKDFSQFKQFTHLENLCYVEPGVLEQSYKADALSRWGQLKDFKYHFVGVIRLHPESPSRTAIYVLPGKVTPQADLYTPWKSAAGEVSWQRIISKQGPRKFSKVPGVDYSNMQGIPLFVRSEHYVGEED